MKLNHLFVLLFSVILLISATSCKKYPDGPTISFRTKKARIVNEWKVDEIKVNGFEDVNAPQLGQIWEFAKDNEYTVLDNLGAPISAGTWHLNGTDLDDFFKKDKKTRIDIVEYPSFYTGLNRLNILKLKNKELWVSTKINGNNIEFHFLPS